MKKFIAITGCLFITSCMQAEDPKVIAQQYWLAMQAGDYANARTLVSTSSQSSFDEYTRIPDNHKPSLDAVTLLDSHTTVSTVINSGNNSAQFDTVLVMQNGQWLVNATATNIPPARTALEQRLKDMTKKLAEEMDSNVEQLEATLGEGMDLLNDLMRSGSQELNESVNNSMQQLNESIREAVRKLEERRRLPAANDEPI